MSVIMHRHHASRKSRARNADPGATDGVIPEPFDDPELHEIWAVNQ
jgi:hypothetical protein